MTAERWFYLEASGQRQGPLDLEGLVALIFDGKVPQDVLVWKQGLSEWRKADSVEEIARRIPPSIPPPVTGGPPPVPTPRPPHVEPTARTTPKRGTSTTPSDAKRVGWILVGVDVVLLLLLLPLYPPEAAPEAAEGVTKMVISAAAFAWSLTLGGSRLWRWRFAVIMAGVGAALVAAILIALLASAPGNADAPRSSSIVRQVETARCFDASRCSSGGWRDGR
jgi:hypothetical protein